MEEEMEIEPVFEVREIDLDYEFDAARWFDLTREESLVEAREAEFWFESAKSYPPSPFIVKLVMREDISLENVNTSPKLKDGEDTTALLNDDTDNGLGPTVSATDVNNRDFIAKLVMREDVFLENVNTYPKLKDREDTTASLNDDTDNGLGSTVSATDVNNRGLTCSTHISGDKLSGKMESSVKPFCPRSSTLMKPTASQLAKQNHSRFQMLLAQNNERSFCNSSVVESQAAKRQKLEGGLLHKVADAKQQTNLVHKPPKKDETVDLNSTYARMKITIPREPDLETAHRAHRIRPKKSTQLEHVSSVAHRFKARPLNRKILEAPSLPLPKKSTPRLPEFQEFHLKTSERAMQHSSAVSSSTLQCNDCDKGSDNPITIIVADNRNRESKRPSAMDAAKQNCCDVKYNFKARPLNKKILSSKGDIGIFRNRKRETTVPMEFNFNMERRVQQHLPIELFSKLSLTSELQPNNGSQLKFPRPTCISMKGSKENRLNSFQAGNQITHIVKEKLPIFGGKQIQCGKDGCDSEVSTHWTATRSLGPVCRREQCS